MDSGTETNAEHYAQVLSDNVARLIGTSYGNLSRFSLRCGISRATLYRLMRCETSPRLDEIVQIADAFGVTPVQLITENAFDHLPPSPRSALGRTGHAEL